MLTLQVLVNGVLLGGLYTCMAIGFSLIWGVMNLVNLAHGSMIVLGAYVTLLVTLWTGLDPFLAVPLAGFLLFALGHLLQRYVLNLVLHGSIFMTLIVTFGIDMVLMNVMLALFTADIRAVSPPYAGLGLELGAVQIPYVRIAVFAAALLLTIGLHLFMSRTRLGIAIKATSFDRDAAALSGIDTGRIYAITFALGAGMAGMAGALMSMVYPFAPAVGDGFTMKAFVVVALGGLGSVPGAILGGLVLGIAENLASVVLDAGYRDAISFLLLVLILVLRPQGMLGKAFYAEVKA